MDDNNTRTYSSYSMIMYYSIIGADITDFFNYGFNEEIWKQYCEKQRKLRAEITNGLYNPAPKVKMKFKF